MSYHLIDVIQRLGHPRILVVGDLILDRYVWGDAERVSQEAPVVLLREDKQEVRLGGASNVANLLRGLEADVVMAGVVGDDTDGGIVRSELQSAGVDCSAVLGDPLRPTTVKQRFIGLAQHRHPHQILRVDREVRTPLAGDIETQMEQAIAAAIADCDAVLISDYAKGVCTPRILQSTIQVARTAGIPVVVDPAANGDYTHYRGATAITPNRAETGRAVDRPISTSDDAFEAGRELRDALDLDYCFVTLDSDGIALIHGDTAKLHSTRKREVYDITGAGDMVLAIIGVGAAAGIEPPDLARLANIAGGLEVEQVGVVRVTRGEMLADLMAAGRQSTRKITELNEVERHVDARRKLGQTIVFTNGCFDLLHLGHITYLKEAREQGDLLIVGLNSDTSVTALKGPQRPVRTQAERAEILAALECVDFVVIFNELSPRKLIEAIRPDVLVKGGDYRGKEHEVTSRDFVESYGGRFHLATMVDGVSTTRIIDSFAA